MPKAVVVYRSISGFTKRYAEWIAEDLKADLFDVREIDVEKLLEYDILVFGGSLHAVGINGVKTIKENLPKLSNKRIVVFAVGASPPRAGIEDEIRNSNFSSEEQRSIRFFYLRGGFNYNKLDRANKILMALYRVRISMKKNKTPDEKGMLAAYSVPINCVRKENIEKIIEHVQSFGKPRVKE